MGEFLFVCEICGSVLNESNCKARCPNCGRTLDCSDLPSLQADGMLELREDNEVHFIPRPANNPASQQDKKLEPPAKPEPPGN